MTGKFDIHFLWERCACGADTITSLLGCTSGPRKFRARTSSHVYSAATNSTWPEK